MIQSKFILQSLVLIVAGVFATAQVYAQSQVQMNLLAHSDSVYTFAKAADSISKYLQSVNTNDTSEGGTLRAFSQWVRFSEQRVCNNAPQGANRLSVASKALVNYTKNFSSNCASNAQVWQGSWQCVGPYINSYGNHQEQSGRIDALWIHPTNANYILAGASSGGIWKTIDGGLSWYNITDASLNAVSGTTGINIIAVNPLHLDTMFAATGKVTGNKNNWGYSVGLIYTTNGGAHWQRDSNADTVVAKQNDFWDANIQQLVYLPGTTKLLLAYKDSIYIKHNLQDVWHNITPAFDSAKVTDIKFTNSNPSKALVKTSPRFGISKIWILDNGIWNQQIIDLDTNVIYQKYTEEENISLSLQDDVYLNIAKKTPGKLLVKHSLSSNTNTLLNTNMGNFQFIVVSPAHDSVFYATRHTGASGNDLLVSYNRGQSFNASISNNIHADVRYITVQKSFDTFRAVKDFVFAGTDGGIVCKKPYQTGFSSITGAGICVSQLYGFATTDQDEDIMEGGAQDNSSYSYIKSRTPQWVSGEIGGDNYLSEFQKNGRKVYSEYNFPYMGGIQFHVNNTSSPFSFSNPEDGKISAADQSGIRDPGTGYIYLWHPHAQDTRPLSLTETDAYVGYYHIWKKNIDSLNWQRVFAADPIMPILTDSLFDKRMIRDFIISEKDSVAYVAYKMPAYGNPVGTGNANGKLFFTNKLTPSLDGLTANWINITPAEVEWLRIMDIETDPNNLGRIWVALGEIDWGNITSSPQQMTNRIKYSNDYGQTWIDVSKGLPPLPVNKIIYQQGSDNILYAGTDAGVFKWNSANQEWECFNNGFPNCLVTDMEINYCAGKLRIATYGRGIWETSIMESAPTSGNPQVGNVTPIPTETITTNTTWTSDKYITTGIHITNNATLTISGTTTTIHMPNNGAIVVEPGTTLIVDGAKITNDCHGFWLGIEALGNSNQPQNGTTQATVLMYNGATIEHARFAIANWNHQSLANTGAIINVNGCHFINNHKSVELQLYHHLDANYNPIPYKATFRNCDFMVDNNYRGDALDYNFDAHASMWEVEGVRFYGCKFHNTNTGASKGNGFGINSYNAGYTVLSSPPGFNPSDRSVFNGFKAGILAAGDNFAMQPNVMVRKADFDINSIGIWAKNVHNFSSFENSYTIGHAPMVGSCYNNIGIYSINCHQFAIEENAFTGVNSNMPSGWENIGSLTENSGESDKEISKNNFQHLEVGCLAVGKNSDTYIALPNSNLKGLRYMCNSYTENTKDIVVLAGSNTEGIAKIQGSLLSSTGNTFSPAGYFYNNGHPITYYHSGGNTLPGTLSSNIFPTTAPAKNCANGLPSPTDRGPLSAGDRSTLINSLYASIAIRDNKKAVYQALMDGGNSETLINYLNNQSSFNAMDVRDFILALSPYVSDSMVQYLVHSELLPESMLFQALAANPEALQNQQVLDDILNSGLELTTQDLQYLDYLAFNTTARTSKEAEIGDANYMIGYALNRLMMDAKADTTAIRTDSVLAWLQAINEPWADYDATGILYAKGETNTADNMLEGLSGKYNFDDAELLNHQTYISLWNLMKTVQNEVRNIYSLQPSEKETLLAIAQGDAGNNAKNIAQAILEVNGDLPHKMCAPIVGNPTVERRYKSMNIKDRADGLSVRPNPADAYVLFTYKFPLAKSALSIKVFDISGRQVTTMQLKGNNGQEVWDVRNIAPGTYSYTLYDGNMGISYGKVIVIKR